MKRRRVSMPLGILFLVEAAAYVAGVFRGETGWRGWITTLAALVIVAVSSLGMKDKP